MNIILIEDSRYVVDSFIESVYKLFPYSSRATLSKRNINDVIKRLNVSPLLTKGWLVNVVGSDYTDQQLKAISIEDNVNIFNITSKLSCEKLVNQMKGLSISYKVVDNLNLPKAKLESYVQTTLDIKLEDAQYICKRHRYYTPKIMESVSILSTFDKIDRKIIRLYTERFNSISLYDLVEYLLGISNKVSYKRVVELVHDYKFGSDFLINFIKSELEFYIKIYELIDSGLLGSDNLKDYIDEHRSDKLFSKVSEFRVKKIIDNRKLLSFDKLWFIYLQVSKIGTSRYSLYELINLLKVGG